MSDIERQAIRDRAKEDAVLAMQTVVGWAKMTDLCEARDGIGCTDCPYAVSQPCARPSTTALLLDAAILFERYLVLTGKNF